jgi:hypothetical protein
VANILMNRIDDGLAAGTNIVDVFTKIQNPTECLLRWRNVVALRAKDDNRRTDIAQIDGEAV